MLVLASASPRRREMLARLGLPHRTEAVAIDERPRPGETPAACAERLCLAKADAASRRHPEAWVLAADTIVALGAAIFGKPAGRVEARDMLAALAGRTHEVLTAYCLRAPAGAASGAPALVRTVRTEVDVAPLDAAALDAYLDSGEWQDKAGAYAIQGLFAYAVAAIRGSYTNVVGLPLCEIVADLRRLGVVGEAPRGSGDSP